MTLKNITSEAAYQLLENQDQHLHSSYLIDVRSQAEWQEVGIPQLKNSEVLFLSLFLSPSMSYNVNFYTQLMQKITDKEANLFFLCRSGGRSAVAGTNMVNYGYQSVFNITDGFEGAPSTSLGTGPGTALGWKNNNLPWQK